MDVVDSTLLLLLLDSGTVDDDADVDVVVWALPLPVPDAVELAALFGFPLLRFLG